MSVGNEGGTVGAIKFDLRVMHETWMELLYPRQRGAADTVLGKWKPETTLQVTLYRLWYGFGIPVVGVIYPTVLLGYFLRFQTRRVNITAERLGVLGVLGLFILLWGGLSAVVFQFSGIFDAGAVTAILAASGVAVVSAGLSFGFWRLGGRITTILFAYPFAMTALFLPPVVAALFVPALTEAIIDPVDDFISYLVVDVGLDQLGPVDWLNDRYDRQPHHHAVIWFVVSFPVGWILAIPVTLADLIRPKGD